MRWRALRCLFPSRCARGDVPLRLRGRDRRLRRRPRVVRVRVLLSSDLVARHRLRGVPRCRGVDVADSACLAGHHTMTQGFTCTTCHDDDGALSEAHTDMNSGKTPKKLKKTEVNETVCLSCMIRLTLRRKPWRARYSPTITARRSTRTICRNLRSMPLSRARAAIKGIAQTVCSKPPQRSARVATTRTFTSAIPVTNKRASRHNEACPPRRKEAARDPSLPAEPS